MKKIFLIVLLFFSSCGYNSIYVNKNLKNLEFNEIALEGDARINKIIISSLSLKKDVLNDNLNKLFLRTNYRIDETSKNSKGKVKTYRSVIIVEVDISKNNKILNSKKIEKNFSYNNVSNKYELVEYQNKIKTDLIDGILEEIILFLNLG